MLDHLERFGLRIAHLISIVGLSALMFLALMTLADGMLRWLFSTPIEGVRDAGSLAIAVAVACCIPVGLIERSNITLRFMQTVAGPATGKVLDAFASLVVGAVIIAVAWQFTQYAGKLARAGETTWVLKIPVAPFWYGVSAIFWISVLVQSIVIIQDFARAFGRSRTSALAHHEVTL